jgi:uncharacterized protein (TIGR03437 family)
LHFERYGHTLTLLPDGRVLAVGGSDDNSAEIFDSGAAAAVVVSAASLAVNGVLAPESLGAILGVNLSADTQSAPALPLPEEIAGVRVKIRDQAGAERMTPLLRVAPGRIDFQVPSATASGSATVTVANSGGVVAGGLVEIARVAPGLFTANGDGQGVAAAMVLRVTASGVQQAEPVARFDAAQNRYVAEPIGLGPESDQVLLILYGTGIRFRSALSAATLTLGGVNCQATFAGAVPGFVGFDQVNLLLPRTLAGRGEVDVTLSVDGKAANPVRVSIR